MALLYQYFRPSGATCSDQFDTSLDGSIDLSWFDSVLDKLGGRGILLFTDIFGGGCSGSGIGIGIGI